MIGDTTHYPCEHNLRVQVSPFMYICVDMLYNYIMHRDIMYMHMINKLLLLLLLLIKFGCTKMMINTDNLKSSLQTSIY